MEQRITDIAKSPEEAGLYMEASELTDCVHITAVAQGPNEDQVTLAGELHAEAAHRMRHRKEFGWYTHDDGSYASYDPEA